MLRTLSSFLSLAVLTAGMALAQPQPNEVPGTPADGPAFAPNVKPALYVTALDGAIEVDGHINEAGWRSAARALNFSERFPGDQTRPPIDVEAYMAYDATHLYVAFDIKDDPKTIRANFSDRDNIWQDDYVGLILDTQGDGRDLYFIASNPLGIQADTRITTNNEDEGFDIVFSSAGQITDDGYQVEMAIPFRSLRFPATDVQSWRGTFWITHPRDSRAQYSWATISRDDPCWPCQFGSFEGIEGVTSGKNLEILPAITGSQGGELYNMGDPNSGFNQGRVTADPSLNLKYGFTSDLTADLAFNPDFSQIEADVAQIDVNSTFALFFPERRPFFQEGSDLFDTEISTVYTRSINDPSVASKFTGRFGKTNVAYIGARDETSPLLMPFEERSELVRVGKSFSNVLRVVHNLENNSYVGALVTDRRLDEGGGGSTAGLDASIRFLKNFMFTGQVVASQTQEINNAELSPASLEGVAFDNGRYTAALDGESFSGFAYKAEVDYNSRHWFWEVGYEDFSPTFRAENGFINQNNYRRLFLFQGFAIYPEKIGFIDSIRPRVFGSRTWNTDALRKNDFFMPGVFMEMKGQTRMFAGYRFSRERFAGIEFDGLTSLQLFANTNFSQYFNIGFELSEGKSIARNVATPEIGNSTNFSVFSTIRPTDRLRISPQFSYSKLADRQTGENFFDGYIARARINYQFSRRFFLRTVVQYNDFAERLEIDPLLTYRINPFTAFYVGSTHRLDTYPGQFEGDPSFLQESQRQFFFKFQYLLRR